MLLFLLSFSLSSFQPARIDLSDFVLSAKSIRGNTMLPPTYDVTLGGAGRCPVWTQLNALSLVKVVQALSRN